MATLTVALLSSTTAIGATAMGQTTQFEIAHGVFMPWISNGCPAIHPAPLPSHGALHESVWSPTGLSQSLIFLWDVRCVCPLINFFRAVGYPSNATETAAELLWLENGGRGLDTAWSYNNQAQVGAAMSRTAVKRSDIFLTTKVSIDSPCSQCSTGGARPATGLSQSSYSCCTDPLHGHG